MRATIVYGLPDPPPAGSADGFRISGLDADRSYGVGARAVDEAGNISPLSPPLVVRTADQPPPPPPDRSEGAIDGEGEGDDWKDGPRSPFADPGAEDDSRAGARRFSLRGPIAGADAMRLAFEVQLPPGFFPRDVVLHIEDEGGREVWRAEEGSWGREGVTRFVWDLRDTSGAIVPSGAYYAVAAAGSGRILNRFDLLH
jgi:hypothetical protein